MASGQWGCSPSKLGHNKEIRLAGHNLSYPLFTNHHKHQRHLSLHAQYVQYTVHCIYMRTITETSSCTHRPNVTKSNYWHPIDIISMKMFQNPNVQIWSSAYLLSYIRMFQKWTVIHKLVVEIVCTLYNTLNPICCVNVKSYRWQLHSILVKRNRAYAIMNV